MKGEEFATAYCALARPCPPGEATPTACEKAVAAALPPIVDEAARDVSLKALRAAQSAPSSCGDPMALAIVAKAVPLDAPRDTTDSDIQTVFSVVLAADGTTQVDDRPVPNDEAVLGAATAARAKNPELRSVIKADSAVPHGRVIRVLDMLKQARIGKIAFGVQPVAPASARP